MFSGPALTISLLIQYTFVLIIQFVGSVYFVDRTSNRKEFIWFQTVRWKPSVSSPQSRRGLVPPGPGKKPSSPGSRTSCLPCRSRWRAPNGPSPSAPPSPSSSEPPPSPSSPVRRPLWPAGPDAPMKISQSFWNSGVMMMIIIIIIIQYNAIIISVSKPGLYTLFYIFCHLVPSAGTAMYNVQHRTGGHMHSTNQVTQRNQVIQVQ